MRDSPREMEKTLPRQVDTVVVGNGPSALILSYILHGHIPTYDVSSPHPENLLHEKLKSTENLLNLDVDHITEHFGASRFSYSTQALPVNVLVDTLIRPSGETDDVESKTCVKWQYDPRRAVSHIVVGNTNRAGGQWVDNPVKASWDIGTLSYAGMLSLPGYSFADFYFEKFHRTLPFYLRPSRRDVTEYFASYPNKVGISDSIYSNTTFSGVRRRGNGFHIASHNVKCQHLILASGTYTKLVNPRPLLQPLLALPEPMDTVSKEPVLVIGSGFSAADVIISTPASRKIIHIYKWAPTKSPSPLKACHQNAYPEYAGVYRKMKTAALSSSKARKGGRPLPKRSSSSAFDQSRDWMDTYEGLPNTEVVDVEMRGDSAVVTFKSSSGTEFSRTIGSLAYVVGRRGSLSYLDKDLRAEICPTLDDTSGVSGSDLREAANEDLEVAGSVFIVGSLTGDTLIRFAYGGCVYAAGKIIDRGEWRTRMQQSQVQDTCYSQPCYEETSYSGSGRSSARTSGSGSPTHGFIRSMHGFDGHELRLTAIAKAYDDKEKGALDTTLDRRKVVD